MKCPSCQVDMDPSATACTHCGSELSVTAPGVSASRELAPGTLFGSRYEILQLTGRGGMGIVYKARDRALDEIVAIKVLRPEVAQDPRMAERFKTEIKLARKVRHRNVCAIHDYGEDQGLFYISMEFIEGKDLKRDLRQKGRLPPEEAYGVAIQAAEGLQAIHEAGIIHRDLKAANIIRDRKGVARLMDFGVAKQPGADGNTITAIGQIVGTPEYMSPEQAQGHKIDFRADVYALGVVIYELFTGRVPFRGETPISTILKHLHEPPPLEGEHTSGIPPGLRPVLRKALAKDPGERYSSAREMAEALRRARSPSLRQELVSTNALEAPTVVDERQTRRPRRRRREWLALLIAGAAATVAAFLLLRLPTRLPEPPSAGPAPVEAGSGPPSSVPASPVGDASVASDKEPMTGGAASQKSLTSAQPRASGAARSVSVAGREKPVPRNTERRGTPEVDPISSTVAGEASSPGPSAPPPARVPSSPTAPPDRPSEEGTGWLQIAVLPWAEVVIDGKGHGTTPIDKIPLLAGTHRVRLRHPTYEELERVVTIRAGQTEKVVINFALEGLRKHP